MGTHTQLIYHIVYSTKHREPTMVQDEKKRLFAFIHHLLTNKNCHLYRINGMEDHLHILTHIHPTIAISSLVKDIKLASDDFIKREDVFPKFKGWQDGYGAFTESIKEKDRLIAYIRNQEEHHRKVSFLDEYKALLKEHEIEFDEKYLL
ncbi:REP element-mobilizing transposase RayT [Algoriphagus aquaeductus]|jgi:putative transposase|uniref:REP element-mobilizing transposase RayT n=1 Tax=Algoriphagus aquaeductus TaxID=475299 RepID=A0A326RS86_9BACT|nr:MULTISPECIES: IS200/IS605 family transposase [Algoriphagus]PZV81568.1 REP element-mobilizing transposase RayT [Algoriphagus aquaeductus]